VAAQARLVAFAVAALFLAARLARAQEVYLDRGTFSWTAPTTGDPPTVYHVKCGRVQGGPYPKVIDVAPPTISLKLSAVEDTPAVYYCVVTAGSASGEGAASNEITVTADAPAPTILRTFPP
jgi:hypothetical protein